MGERKELTMSEAAVFFFVAAIALFVFFRKAVKRARQATDLVSRGTPVTAKIVKLEKKRRSRSRTSYRLRYRFTTSGGVDYEHVAELGSKEFANHAEGQDIEVVYDPTDPSVNMMKSMVDMQRNAINKSPIKD